MTNSISNVAARAILARQTDQLFLACLTIEHESIETIRIVNNTEPVVRTVGTFQPYPFVPILPEDTEEVGQSVSIQIDNISRDVTRLIRDLTGVPTATLEVILAGTPDVVELGPFEFSVLSAEYDSTVITLSLGHEEDFMNQSVPSQTYNPSNSASLWP